MRILMSLLIGSCVAGCASESSWNVGDEVDWSVPDLPIQDFTWYPSDLPVVHNRVHLYKTGTPTMIILSYWDGVQWLESDRPVEVPADWYIGPSPCCAVETVIDN